MSSTPTSALVEEAETHTTCDKCGAAIVRYSDFTGLLPTEDGMRSHTPLVCERTQELRRAEAEREEAQRDAESYKRQTQEVSAKAIELTKEVCAKLDHAIAERDELRATVTRLNRRAQTAEAGVRDNVEACKAAGVSMGRTLANAAADMYLRRAEQAEAERDAALKQSAAWEIQAQDMRDRLVRAEAERDAQSEQVLRLTGERDEAKGRIDRILDPPIKRMNMANGEINVVLDAPEMARIMATTFWEYLDERKAKNYVEMCFARPEAPTKRVIVTVRKLIGRTPEELREAVAKERDELLEKIKELESTRNLLLTENARLQARVATLELLRRGGK